MLEWSTKNANSRWRIKVVALRRKLLFIDVGLNKDDARPRDASKQPLNIR